MPFILDPPIFCEPANGHNYNSQQSRPISSMPSLFGSLRFKASKKSSNKRSSTNQSSLSADSNSSTTKSQHMRNPFSRSPSTRRPDPPFQSNNAFATITDDAPPAYSAAPTVATSSYTATPSDRITTAEGAVIRNTKDDDYSSLREFDTVFLIDDSGSMAGRSWRETAEALKTITPICTQYDADGIDIYFLNTRDSFQYKNVTSPATVEAIFNSVRPGGGTPTGMRLHSILKPYLKEVDMKGEDSVKPLNIIVITDGQATDDVESVILSAARKLDRLDACAWQVGIQFFQVGNDKAAEEMLKELDDNLTHKDGKNKELRDMVDTVPFKGERGTTLNGEGILKCVLGAVNKRHDRTAASSSKYH